MRWSVIHYQCSEYAPDLLSLPGTAFQLVKWFRVALEAWILWYRCESIVKLILDISVFQAFEQPVQSVFNETEEQLMQFITLPKPMDIEEM